MPINTLVEDGAYTWWTNALSLRYVGDYDKTYISYVNKSGQMTVTSIEANIRESFILADYERDDHNSAALATLPGGRILAIYTRHSADNLIRWRISNKEDIRSFTKEKQISSKGSVTYIQIHRISEYEYRIFYRYSMNNWATRIYDYRSDSFTEEKVWLNEAYGGQYYLWTQEDKEKGKINIVMTCHPTNGKDQNIRYGYFDKEGNICTNKKILGNLNEENKLSPRDFEIVYEPEEGTRTRLYDLSFKGQKIGCLFGIFTSAYNSQYMYAYYDKGKWTVEKVSESGSAAVLGNHYFGGISFSKNDMQTLYLSREKEGKWTIEKWETKDFGKSWISKVLDSSANEVLIRPTLPFNTKDKIEVIYMKGQYPSYHTYDTKLVAYSLT